MPCYPTLMAEKASKEEHPQEDLRSLTSPLGVLYLASWAVSSVRQSRGLLSPRSQVRILHGSSNRPEAGRSVSVRTQECTWRCPRGRSG